jgi:hypothetical protein
MGIRGHRVKQDHRRGEIYCEAAFAQGKMHDSSGWSGILPRHISPSDIDLAFDNLGYILFMEMSRNCSSWSELEKGQFSLYENLVRNCPEKHIAALCTHHVPLSRRIDTLEDIESFQLLFCRRAIRKPYPKPVIDTCISEVLCDPWKGFVLWWFRNPIEVMDTLRTSDFCRVKI